MHAQRQEVPSLAGAREVISSAEAQTLTVIDEVLTKLAKYDRSQDGARSRLGDGPGGGSRPELQGGMGGVSSRDWDLLSLMALNGQIMAVLGIADEAGEGAHT
jgi:hypothetical protein